MRPTQGSNDGWAASKLVGNSGRTPTTGQKQLGKNGKSYHDKQYKKALTMHNKEQQERIRENTENRKVEETKKTNKEN